MIDYNGRRFRPAGDGAHSGATATYWQRGDLVWAEFAGGPIRHGALAGLRRADDTLEFAYGMVLADGSILSGRCTSTPELLPDGRIRLHEQWERFGGNAATGTSALEEI